VTREEISPIDTTVPRSPPPPRWNWRSPVPPPPPPCWRAQIGFLGDGSHLGGAGLDLGQGGGDLAQGAADVTVEADDHLLQLVLALLQLKLHQFLIDRNRQVHIEEHRLGHRTDQVPPLFGATLEGVVDLGGQAAQHQA
jgi:hypothetical protein